MSEFEPCVKKLRNDHHDLAVFMILSQLAAAASYFPQTKVCHEFFKGLLYFLRVRFFLMFTTLS